LKLVIDIKAKYSVYNDNIYNFDKTGFQIGIIGTIKVVTVLRSWSGPEQTATQEH
jgi:hypothetical protein